MLKLGLNLAPPDQRISQILGRVDTLENVPSQLANVEAMIGYTFNRKLLLIEALTHASYENDLHTTSYERMEFLGDSVLDMVVTNYLYHAPGKKYSPGHLHLRRSALVNAHFLAYICLCTSTQIKTMMPRVSLRTGADGGGEDGESESRSRTPWIELATENQEKYLWQCLLHSSPRVLEDQTGTYDRFQKRRAEIESYLGHSDIFPWASLTRLQAPKFFSDIVESVIGAVFLDCGGDLSPDGAVQSVMRHLGILDVLEWVITDNVDVLHPVSLVCNWVGKRGKVAEYKFEKEKGMISCVVLLDGEEVTVKRSQVPVLSAVALAAVGGLRVVEKANTDEEDVVVLKIVDVNRGKTSEGEVKFAAAEAAIRAFRLRDADINNEIMKKKRSRPKKKKGKGPSTAMDVDV
ncbi:hypothetical protein AX15_003738 [Amanita polypyramis BW_CC]|nr:hypothetical protein AX15_003738 [Amanita polypyramis BW_CC]